MNRLQKQIELFSTPIEGIIDRPTTNDRPARVKALGTIWNARLYQLDGQIAIAADVRVLIVGRQGITLLIQPLF
jgi:membrane protein implicated in regulation of membrane protease activity